MNLFDMISGAYERALRNTEAFQGVYRDPDGNLFTAEGASGSLSDPTCILNGGDIVAVFDFQYRKPEDGDDMFRENLESYLSGEQLANLISEESETGAVSDRELIEMFPEQYKEYCEDRIQDQISEFCPEDYLAGAV